MGSPLSPFPSTATGFVDLEVLEERVDESVLLVSVMAVNNEVGTNQDIPRIAELLAPHGIVFHCDAAQAPCATDVSDLASHADLISLSAHKFYGPQGIGALYIRRDLKDSIEPIIYGGGQQEGLRSGTVPMPLCVGMGTAAEIVARGEAKEERKRVAGMRDAFILLLESGEFPITVNGPIGQWRHPGNANICFDGVDAQDILGVLQPRLAASTGAACTTGIPEPSQRTTGRSACRTRRATPPFASALAVSLLMMTSKNAARLVSAALATVSAEAITS